MRKQYKDKRASCPLCKPHKRKWENRWKVKDLDLIKRSEKIIQESKGNLTGTES